MTAIRMAARVASRLLNVVLRLSGEPASGRSGTPPAIGSEAVKQGEDIPVIHFQVSKDVVQYLREVTGGTSDRTASPSDRFAGSPVLERLTTVLSGRLPWPADTPTQMSEND